MPSTKGPFVSVHGKRLGLAPGFQYVDGAPAGPPLNVSASVVGNTATITEQTLKSYALPEYGLKSANHGIVVQAFGRLAGNANTKRVTLYVGGVNITTASVTSSGSAWMLSGQFIKTAANAQRAFMNGQIGATALAITSGTDTSTDTSTITISLKATCGSATVSEVFCDALVVGFQ